MSTNQLSGRFEDLLLAEVKCIVCSNESSVPAGSVDSHGVSFQYKICTNCGLKFMNPRPTKDWYEAHYAKVFWQYKMDNRSWQDAKKRWRMRDVARKNASGRERHQTGRLGYLIPLFEKHTQLKADSNVLDIGCAFGAIGKGISDNFGCKIYGVEPNVDAHEVARNENNIEIIAKSAEELFDLKGYEKKFDLILMSNVLENILDPVPVLASLRGMLSEGGVVCIHMPNFYYYDAMNPYHPYIYSSDTLSRICYQAGLNAFKIVEKPAVKMASNQQNEFRKTDLFMTIFADTSYATDKEFATPDPDLLIERQRLSMHSYAQTRNKPVRKLIRKIRKVFQN